MEHASIKSCWRLEKIQQLITEDLNSFFKGKSKLGKTFDQWVSFFDKMLKHWKKENASDIPNCVACSTFVKESKAIIILERKLNF